MYLINHGSWFLSDVERLCQSDLKVTAEFVAVPPKRAAVFQ